MRGKPFNFTDFRKGIAYDGDYLLDPKFLRDALNLVPTETGTLKTRPGANVLSGGPGSGNYVTLGMGGFEPASGVKFLVWVDSTPVVRALRPDTGVSQTITPPAPSNARRYSFAQAPASGGQGPLFASNGSGTPWAWDGGAGAAVNWTASAGALPNGKYLLYHADRMWVAGVTASPNTVYWSSVGDPRNWSSVAPNDAGSVDIEPNDGDAITGLGIIGPYILVFKKKKTFLMYEPALATGANRKIANEVGCIGHWTISPSPYGTLFMSVSGLKVTDGQGIRDASRIIDEKLRLALPGAISNLGALMAGTYFKDHYYLSGPWANMPPIMDWNIKADSWWSHGLGANGAVGLREIIPLGNNNGGLSLYGAGRGSVDNNYRGIYDLFQTEDLTLNPLGDEDAAGATQNVLWRLDTAWHTLGNPHLQKRIREIRVDADGSVTTWATFTTRDNGTFTTLDNVDWEALASGYPSEHRYYTPGWGRALALRMFGTFGAEREIGGYTIAAEQRAD